MLWWKKSVRFTNLVPPRLFHKCLNTLNTLFSRWIGVWAILQQFQAFPCLSLKLFLTSAYEPDCDCSVSWCLELMVLAWATVSHLIINIFLILIHQLAVAGAGGAWERGALGVVLGTPEAILPQLITICNTHKTTKTKIFQLKLSV